MAPRRSNCQRCRQKKLRCSQGTPCSACFLRNEKCIYPVKASKSSSRNNVSIPRDQSDQLLNKAVFDRLSECERELQAIRQLLQKREQEADDNEEPRKKSSAEIVQINKAIDHLPHISVLRNSFLFYLERINQGFYALDPQTSLQQLDELWQIISSTTTKVALTVYAITLCAGFDPDKPDKRNFTMTHDFTDVYTTITWLYTHTKEVGDANLNSMRVNLLLCTLTSTLYGPKEATKLLIDTARLVANLRLDYEPDLKQVPVEEAKDRVQLYVMSCALDWMSTPFYKPFSILREDFVNFPCLFSRHDAASWIDPYVHFRFKLAKQSKRAFERKYQSAEQIGLTNDELQENSIQLDNMVLAMLKDRSQISDPLERCLQQSSLRILQQMQDFLFHRGLSNAPNSTAQRHALTGISIFANLVRALAHSVGWLDGWDAEELVIRYPAFWHYNWLNVELTTIFLVFCQHTTKKTHSEQHAVWEFEDDMNLANRILQLLKGKTIDDLQRTLQRMTSTEHGQASDYGSSILVTWLTEQSNFC